MKTGTWNQYQKRYISWSTGAVTTEDAQYHTKVVSANPVAQGNFVDPKNWQYYVDDYCYPEGDAVLYQPGNIKISRTESGPVRGAGTPPIPDWQRAPIYNAALAKLNRKVRGELDLSVEIAQAGLTKRQLQNFWKLESGLRFGRLKAVSQGWLQFQYGWRPLLSDFFAVADEARRIVFNRLQRYHAREKRLPEGIASNSAGTSYGPVPAAYNVTGVESCTIVIWLSLPASAFDIARWTSLNPVNLGWELIPYSFVVDWFLDVGGWLRNLESAVRYNTFFHSGFVSELRAVNVVKTTGSAVNYPSGNKAILGGSRSARKRIDFQRSVLTQFPFPYRPSIDVNMGAARLTSAAALVSQILGPRNIRVFRNTLS